MTKLKEAGDRGKGKTVHFGPHSGFSGLKEKKIGSSDKSRHPGINNGKQIVKCGTLYLQTALTG